MSLARETIYAGLATDTHGVRCLGYTSLDPWHRVLVASFPGPQSSLIPRPLASFPGFQFICLHKVKAEGGGLGMRLSWGPGIEAGLGPGTEAGGLGLRLGFC